VVINVVDGVFRDEEGLGVRSFVRWGALALTVGSSTPCLAQAGAIIDLFGGLLEQQQILAAQQAWARTPEPRRFCLERGSNARRRASLTALVQRGITPDHPYLREVSSECLRFERSALKTDFPCSVPDENGIRVQTKCSQQFGRQDAFGRVQMLDPRAAIDLYFSTGTYALAEIESDQGRQERGQQADEQRRAAEVQSLRAQVESFRGSPSDLVRSHAQALLKKLSWNPPLSTVVIETARQDQQALTQLARVETERLEALEKLDAVKRRAESRVTSTFAPELRGELDRLRASYASLSKPLAAATPSPPDSVGIIGRHGGPGRQIVGKQSPSHPAPPHVEDRIHDLRAPCSGSQKRRGRIAEHMTWGQVRNVRKC
jgi:hypothetical protein